ncbi:squalene monooxygenase, partial [Phenoliferia sp. Uapishka_3]
MSQDRIPSTDPIVRLPLSLFPSLQPEAYAHVPQLASKQHYDVAIVGCGIIGSVLAASLANSGRSVIVFDSNLTEPDRSELLQPGGCLALQKLGMGACLDNIDATRCDGYKVFWGSEDVAIAYPEEKVAMQWSDGEVGKDGRVQQGRSFHHGRFVQNLRRAAQSTAGVTLIEGTVNSLLKDPEDRIIGITATPRTTPTSTTSDPLQFHATLTFISDGAHSKFRRQILPSNILPITRSNFIGLILEDADLPAPHHGHVILARKPSSPTPASTEPSPIGPVLVYQLATHETRMLIDIAGAKVPSSSNGDLAAFLTTNVTPVLPKSIVPSFEIAIEKSLGPDREYRLRSMPNQYLPPYPQGRGPEGVVLIGDSLNMRHPLTGGGMTVAFNDAVLLVGLLGGGKSFGEMEGKEIGEVVELGDWELVREKLEEWHWARKGVATCINVLAQALYSLFGADDENLEVLKAGCFGYFKLGGEAVNGPMSLLSAFVLSCPSLSLS